MNLGRLVVSLLKGKVIAAIAVGAVLVGGGTAVMAATSTGQHFIQTLTPQPQAAILKSHDLSTNQGHKNDSSQQNGASDHNNICHELDTVQSLAGKFSLKTTSVSDAIQAICALHNGTFKGVTPNGITVLSQRALNYDEIAQLLKYAEYLANQNKANGSGKLTSDNLRAYLAAALQSCGTTPLATCVKQNISSFLHDITGKNSPNGGTNSGNIPSFDNKNGQGKPIISIPVLSH
jgi:hypothetical protein